MLTGVTLGENVVEGFGKENKLRITQGSKLVLFFSLFSTQLATTDENELQNIVCRARELRPNSTNENEILGMMDVTRSLRRGWINGDQPSISEILRRYPRLQDMPSAVSLINFSSCPIFLKLLSSNITTF